jgi:broad specificity phosphatase PhoE
MGSKYDFKSLRSKHHQFFLVIYSDTDADLNRYHCGGGLDLGLNETGMDLARRLSRRFKKNPLKIKKIYSSPELRSIQMADFLHDELKGRIILAREFADQILGDLEGKQMSSGASAFIKEPCPPRGEPEEVFSLRVRSGLERIFQEEDLVLLVTHPRVAQQILAWLGLGSESFERGKMYAIDLPIGQGIAHYREV